MGSVLHDIRERSKGIKTVEEQGAPDRDGEEDDHEVKIIQIVDNQDIRPPPLDQCTSSTERGQDMGDINDPPPPDQVKFTTTLLGDETASCIDEQKTSVMVDNDQFVNDDQKDVGGGGVQ